MSISYSQEVSYSSLLIPDSLKVNSNAVVRDYVLDVTIASESKLSVKKRSVVTVLNKLGSKRVDLHQFYDDDTKINKLSVKIYDAFGSQIKKFSQSKFTDISAVSGGTMYSDNRVKLIEYTPTSYPYTVVFESEITHSSTGFIPQWYPIANYSLSIQKSTYKVRNPLGLTIRKKENNIQNFNIQNLSNEEMLCYELTNQVATKYEKSSLPNFEISPNVLVALNEFTLKNVSGIANNWKDFGQWMYDKLLKGRSELSAATKAEIKDLVKEAKTDIEKAKIVYDYVQDRTRYIGVQIGIGGWSPIKATEVDKMGYGDCKGLTNYTKALLDVVGVKSNHTIVYANKRRDLDKDFSSLQGNHMILNIPQEGEDVWLECTSQIMPFGFLGDFTDDRDVLVITPEGGVIKRTPAYKNETNLQTVKATIVLDIEGNIKAKLNRVSKGIQYDDKYPLEHKSEKDLKEYYMSEVWDYNNNLEITNQHLTNDEGALTFSEDLDININEFAAIANNEYLFRVNVFNKFSYIPKRYRNRKLPFQIKRGFLDEDEFKITIPTGFSIDKLPTPKEIKTKFGLYKISLEKLNETTLVYKKYFLLKAGTHPKEDYNDYRNFLKNVSKYENSRIALQKE